MRISQKTIDQIKNRIDIYDVVSDFFQLKRSGQAWRAKSPFTEEKTPSFYVVPHKGIFKDFSSGKAGDAITFVMEHEGLGYQDALKYLANKYNIEIEEESGGQQAQEVRDERDSLYIILNYAKEYYQKNLWESEEGRSIGLSYFKERRFTNEIIEKFELGYSLNDWNAFENEALAKGYQKEYIEKAGMVVSREDGKRYDRFRGRVMFPIVNYTGKTIGFGARMLGKEKNQPKYLNSPESPVYQKSHVLYGLFQSRQAIRKADNCYLVEGYTDVISLHQHGVENVVASSGTALTADQIRLIKRITENITVLFDGDEAGIRASLRGIDMILEEGMNVRAVAFPTGEDPDSYAQKLGTMTFREFLKDNSVDFLIFKARMLSADTQGDPVKKANSINSIVESISKIPDPVKRAVYLKESSQELDMDESVLIAEMNKIIIRRKREKGSPDVGAEKNITEPEIKDIQPIEKTDALAIQERECIRLLLNYGFNEVENQFKLYDHYLEELAGIEFKTPVYREILDIFKQNIENGNILDLDDYYMISPDHIKKEILKNLDSSKYTVSDRWEKFQIFVKTESDDLANTFVNNILRIKFRKVKEMLLQNREEIKNTSDPEIENELLKLNMELKKLEMEFAKPLGIIIS
ncbi:MAG: DNA primase [Cyclobacteriaceae bacterium]|nr:DNA primase [Cyclobacteriaceae bacterium]